MFKKLSALLVSALLVVNLSGCAKKEDTADQVEAEQKVTVLLDWFPNTNHTGLYVAKDKGFFEAEGLDVEIIQPSEGGTDQLVASGKAQFGVSAQENVTLARVQNVPIVSIAAIIQHNTSGFASKKELNIISPKDFEGKRYGGWGSPVEEAIIKGMMTRENADINKVEFINIGEADFFASIENNIDFAWMFEGWTGVEASLKGIDLNVVNLKDFEPALDYYTPVLITNDELIAKDPELVQAFMKAVSKGYEFCIENPEESAKILLNNAPEINEELAFTSQKWLADKYQAEATRWGEQKLEIWQGYTDWMISNGLMEKEIDVNKAFSNNFLP